MATDLFRTRDHVPDFDDRVREYARLSAEVRASLRSERDVPYGPNPGERLDIYVPANGGASLPVHMFIHGGYWRMFSKDDFSYVARTVTEAGAIAVVIDYALMPSVRLAEVIAQTRNARRWVRAHIGRYGGDPDVLTVSGHSAGAHLATFLFTADQADPPEAALLLGGVYDIRPLRQSFLQPLIELTEAEASVFSPVDHRFNPIDVTILYGERETEPFHTQAAALERRLTDDGCTTALAALEGADHMSSVLDLGFSGRDAGRLLSQMIKRY